MAKTNNYITFDFETSGFDPRKNAMASLAMQAIDGETLQVLAEVEIYFQPYDPMLVYEEAAEKITGLTYDVLYEKGVSLKEAKLQAEEFFRKIAPFNSKKYLKPILVGHNPDFDMGFLQHFCHYTKFKIQDHITALQDYYGNWNYKTIDTMQFARIKYVSDSTMNSFKLTDVVEKEGLDTFDAHSALDDIKATGGLFKSFCQTLQSGGNSDEKIGNQNARDHFQF